jgi:hypothetical protein
MKCPSFKILSTATFLLSVIATTAEAQVVIINENFDGGSLATPGAQLGSYTYGDTTSFLTVVIPGKGVGGSGGWETVNNAASGSLGYSGVGAAFQDGQATGNTSANLSDYTLSFDIRGSAGSFNIKVQDWTLPNFQGTGPTWLDTAPSIGYGDDLTFNSSSFTHYSLNLGTSPVWHYNNGLLMTGGTLQIIFQLDNGGATPYSTTMDIDNLKLTMVPEPSTLALGAMGVVGGLAMFRLRKA